MVGRILSLILKEFQVSWRDKKSRVVLIAPTIMETIIFSFAATMEVANVSVAVLNQDSGHESYELVQRLQASSTFSHFVLLDGVQEIAHDPRQRGSPARGPYPCRFLAEHSARRTRAGPSDP